MTVLFSFSFFFFSLCVFSLFFSLFSSLFFFWGGGYSLINQPRGQLHTVFGGFICISEGPKPCSFWRQCVVIQSKPCCSCWSQCWDTAQALMLFLAPVWCDTTQALVFLPESVCWDTAQALVFFLAPVCCDTA